MNPYDKTTPGKTLIHGNEAGEIDAQTLEQRADEIALIEGRDTTSDLDRQQARKELQGLDLPETTSEDSPPIPLALNRDPSDPISDSGHQVPTYNEADNDDVAERLAIEGLAEAQHEQMLAARRRKAA